MNRSDFYIHIRKSLFISKMAQKQVDGIGCILDEAEKRGTPMRHLAYILATTYHETAKTMQPIAEYGKGRGRPYGKPGKHGQAQYGRGFVQLTWDENYERADKELGLNGALLKNFDLALDPKIATEIMFTGMEEGWFTRRKLSDYLDGAIADYSSARRIINGSDKANLIAGYANDFASGLIVAKYGEKPPEPAPVATEKPTEAVSPPQPTTTPTQPERVPMSFWATVFGVIKILLSTLGKKK